MSWIEQIKTNLQIITGDGVLFTPFWTPLGLSRDFNLSIFEFEGVEGTLVDRKKAKGAKYDLEFFFQGEDHLEQWRAFDNSSKDSRVWTITHPYYGTIIVQPIGIAYDHSFYNVTRISCAVIETIVDDSPKLRTSPIDLINGLKTTGDDLAINTITSISSSQIDNLTLSNKSLYNDGVKLQKDPTSSENYFNAFNKANAAILNATAKPLDAMRALQAVINAPALFTASVRSRLSTFSNQFLKLHNSISTITKKEQKNIFQTNGFNLISCHCIVAINYIPSDYRNRTDVLNVYNTIFTNYNLFLEDLGDLQSPNGGEIDSFIPDALLMQNLDNLIKSTLASLFNIALSAKQERTVLLLEDSNLITEAHKYIGLDENDVILQEFIDNNYITLNEIYSLKKGRKIVYYV